MDYTEGQYALMERLASGVLYSELSELEQKNLRYLDSEKIAEPNAQIRDNWWTLSPKGERTLAARNEKLRIRAEDIRREKEQEQKLFKQAVADKAHRKAEKKADRIFEVFLVFLGYALGLLTPCIPTLAGMIRDGVQLLIRWLTSLI